MLEERFAGAMLGLALGDALGAGCEGGLLEKAAWKVVTAFDGDMLRWTDDTQMSTALAESLLEHGRVEPDSLARLWAERRQALRGYGPGITRLLQRVRAGEDWRTANTRVFPDGSYGNGAAMRSAPLGLFFRKDPAELARSAELAASITHAHPLGVEGAVLMARAAALALAEGPFEPAAFLETLKASCRREEYRSRLSAAAAFLPKEPGPDEVRRALGSGVAAHESVVTALYVFCRFPGDFAAMTGFAIRLGGDTDTIASMAGGVFGARNGLRSLPPGPLARLEDRARIEELGRGLFKRSGG